MNRRDTVLALLALGASPLVCFAQQSGRTYRLGWLSSGALRTEAYNIALVQRLRELGYVEGRNLAIEFRSGEGKIERLPGLAAELARLKCDVLLAPGPEAVLVALKQATRDTPIVAVAIDYDPVSAGHVASLARPGGWITGVSMQQEELATKRLELLKELLPKARRIAVLADTSTTRQLALVWTAARRLGVELVIHEFKGAPYDFDAAFVEFARGKAEALLPLTSGLFVPGRRRITELALKHRLPGMFNNALWAEAGGLISYGVNFPAVYRRVAEIVGMVLKGAKPSEMQVEQSSNFELTVNMRTAKALGFTMPKVFLFRADKLIE